MSRRHAAEKREINPDPKFGDLVVSKFMNSIMQDGKKSVAEAIVYGAFDSIEERSRQNPVQVFHQAPDAVDLGLAQRLVGAGTELGPRLALELHERGGLVRVGAVGHVAILPHVAPRGTAGRSK